MTERDDPLTELAEASTRFRELDAARNAAHQQVISAALNALRQGHQAGDVYRLVPFTSTHIRAIARLEGIPASRPGKRSTKRKPPPPSDNA